MCYYFNALRPEQNGHCFADIFKHTTFYKMFESWMTLRWNVLLLVWLTMRRHWFNLWLGALGKPARTLTNIDQNSYDSICSYQATIHFCPIELHDGDLVEEINTFRIYRISHDFIGVHYLMRYLMTFVIIIQWLRLWLAFQHHLSLPTVAPFLKVIITRRQMISALSLFS